MKCPSVAGLWPDAPPSHRATCAAALPSPAAIYTGGSDGSIVWWSLSHREIRPMALLCGHAASVVALLALSSALGNDAVLVSACIDGVLCIWTASSGRCRRRRKLPPWAGKPVALSPLPSSPGHACLACVSSDSSGQHSNEKRKYAVLIIDSWSLNIQQTVFHGGLPIGSLSAMVALPAEDNEVKRGQNLILVDNHGKVQFLTVPEGDQDAKVVFQQERSSFDVLLSSEESNDEKLQAVAITHDGKLLALVSGSRCILRSVEDNVAFGEIAFYDSSTCNESSIMKSQLSGAVFLEKDEEKYGSRAKDFSAGFTKTIALWSSNGSAALYNVSGGSSTFKCKLLFSVPCSHAMLEGRGSVCFCYSKGSLVRIESLCFKVGGSLLWKPYVTLWSTAQSGPVTSNESGSLYLNKLLGEGGFSGDSVELLASSNIYEAKESLGKSFQHSLNDDYYTNGYLPYDRTVSSSMVLYGDMYAPSAVVYGFYNGQIEVLQFMSSRPQENSDNDSVNHQIYPKILGQIFSGHTGAVLCLAANNLVMKSQSLSFHQVLVSGSIDCTIRIWDLDTCSLLSVLRHHVAPVRQIILPSPGTYRPWSHCFLSVGDDCCVSLVSLETLRVERMFPGHPSYPSMVAWDGIKGYIACLCKNVPLSSDSSSILYLWDVKTGARERIIHGPASQTMLEHFCSGINKCSFNGSILSSSTSASSLLPFKNGVKMIEKGSNMISKVDKSHRRMASFDKSEGQSNRGKAPFLDAHDLTHNSGGNNPAKQDKAYKFGEKKHPVKCSCPFPGIAGLKFDLSSLISPIYVHGIDKQAIRNVNHHEVVDHNLEHEASSSGLQGTEIQPVKESLEGYLLRFSLCFLHLWGIDPELDKLLMDEMNVSKPEGCHIASGVLGDRGTLTLMFPRFQSAMELWKSSSEFCAMRSLAIVSLAQRMINISQTCTTASSALAAFYTRKFAEKCSDIKPPSLQLLVSFWQDSSEHIRMAARTLFHCAAPRAIPYPFCLQKARTPKAASSSSSAEQRLSPSTESGLISSPFETDRCNQKLVSIEDETSSIISWLESFEFQEWTLWVGGTSQDAMAANIIVASALVVWYPSLVKNKLRKLVLSHLIKLVKSTNDRYSSTAAELLAEGMEATWKDCLGSELHHLLGDIFFQIECLSGAPANKGIQNPAVSVTIREALVEILLPSLAMADILGFLSVIESQIWATSSDSPVHLVSLKTLVRVAHGSPKPLVPYLDKAINYVLQTMDPGNLVMRKACLNSSMMVLKEFVRVYPMVAFNQTSTRLAVGDAIGDIHTAIIRVYDIQSVTKVKILDASGPPGLPVMLEGSSKVTTIITALVFSPDGEGLVAFSENGLMIRWWSLGSAWWEKLSRNLVPVPCTKLILVPPWEGFSPNSSRSSIMAGVIKQDEWVSSKIKTEKLDDAGQLKLLIHNLDLSYRLDWVDVKNIKLTHHGLDLGIFQL